MKSMTKMVALYMECTTVLAAPKVASGTAQARLYFKAARTPVTVTLTVDATPLTGALCLAVATRIAGSIPNALGRPPPGASAIRIAHASGRIVVDAKVDGAADGRQPHAAYAAVYRTARRLFDGRVHYRANR